MLPSLEFALHGIKGETTAKNQEGFDIDRLFDFAELGDMWHTKYGAKALPYDMIIDLRTVNQLTRYSRVRTNLWSAKMINHNSDVMLY